MVVVQATTTCLFLLVSFKQIRGSRILHSSASAKTWELQLNALSHQIGWLMLFMGKSFKASTTTTPLTTLTCLITTAIRARSWKVLRSLLCQNLQGSSLCPRINVINFQCRIHIKPLTLQATSIRKRNMIRKLRWKSSWKWIFQLTNLKRKLIPFPEEASSRWRISNSLKSFWKKATVLADSRREKLWWQTDLSIWLLQGQVHTHL